MKIPKIWIFLTVLVLVTVAMYLWVPVGPWTRVLIEEVHSWGNWGVAAFIALYVAFTVFLVPGSVLTLGIAFIYGFWGGFAIVWPASTLGAIAAFGVGRLFGRSAVPGKKSGSKRVLAYNEAIAKRGLLVGFLLRLSPVVPFSLLNYGLAFTKMSARHYVISTALGMIPGIALYVYAGTTLATLSSLGTGNLGTAGYVALIAGLVATFIVVVVVSRVARSTLKELKTSEPPK